MGWFCPDNLFAGRFPDRLNNQPFPAGGGTVIGSVQDRHVDMITGIFHLAQPSIKKDSFFSRVSLSGFIAFSFIGDVAIEDRSPFQQLRHILHKHPATFRKSQKRQEVFRLAPELVAFRRSSGCAAVMRATGRSPEQIKTRRIIIVNTPRCSRDFRDIRTSPFKVRYNLRMVQLDRLNGEIPMVEAATFIFHSGRFQRVDCAGDTAAAAAKKIYKSKRFHKISFPWLLYSLQVAARFSSLSAVMHWRTVSFFRVVEMECASAL